MHAEEGEEGNPSEGNGEEAAVTVNSWEGVGKAIRGRGPKGLRKPNFGAAVRREDPRP